MKNRCYPFINTPLPYGYNALKPFIDEKTMWLHHSRHLQNYIDNLNKLLKENPELLAGFVLRAGDMEYDYSLRGQLAQLTRAVAG